MSKAHRGNASAERHASRSGKPSRFSGRSNRSERPEPWKQKSFGSGSERATSYDAVCGSCGKSCTVPFRPSGSKPVYCRACFQMNGPAEPRNYGGKPRFDKPSFEGKRSFGSPERSEGSHVQEQLKAINAKLDAIIEALND